MKKQEQERSEDVSAVEGIVRCTGWDLIAEHSGKIDTTHAIKLKNGRVLYWSAGVVNNGNTDSVRLQRFDERNGKLHLITRYIKADTPVELIPTKYT